ncbi:hypothetical protein Ari01nite_77570 [Paractinoplanes rishiriensis]|uniref:OmpR/PhoB-type domain-containing protein n=1 Tax=Paractinoplanes rishiriensis TaxID=1050105 RepID=A0A919K6K4_9ACTN|nr:hypothetical protein Ari01nite_77570 [Actinoplanes rishiriensis]
MPTHQIVDAVWGDEPPENGANVVQKYVAGLRRVLDPDRAPRTPGELLALTGSGYVLRTADGTVDADEFQAAVTRAAATRNAGQLPQAADTLRAGLALWRGDALAGLPGPVFEAARTRLAETRATAWEQLADISLSQGAAAALIPDLARLVEEFPLREGLRTHLMIALHQGGRQAEALAVFRDAREYFLDELGAEPGEQMQEAHRKILRGEFDPAPPPADPVSPPPTPAPVIPAQAALGSVSPGPVISGPVTSGPVTSGPPVAPFPASPTAAPGYGPPMLWPAPQRRAPVAEMLAAVLFPFVVCSFGSWIYFVIAGVRRRDPRQFVVAFVYFAIFMVGVVVAFAIDPTSLASNDFSTAEDVGFGILFALPVVSAFHGVLLASRVNDQERTWTLREQARQFVAFAPDQARQIGIGRPDVLRSFDDGGLIDLNHVSSDGLARASGLPVAQAYGIVANRNQHGPFQRPEDLVARGLADPRTVHRLAPRLICIPPGQASVAWPPH